MEYVVDELDGLSAEDFTRSYVRRSRPVVLRNALKGCAAASSWTLDYLREHAGDYDAVLKEWTESGIRLKRVKLRDYIDALDRREMARAAGEACESLGYLHDVPLTSVFSNAARDLSAFPCEYFTSWYGAEWTKFAQMFLGPRDSLTPLHFDCLLTQNIFFQVWGRKRFTLLPHEELQSCYPYDWRWCKIDVERPDYDRYPRFRSVQSAEVIVGPGDLLYMPPGTLHHVRSLEPSLSFNVDWHTRDSALQGVAATLRGMPLKNLYYNALIAFGLWTGTPVARVLPYYKSYLSYVS